MALTRLAGITSATVDGDSYNITEASWSPNTTTKEEIYSLSALVGWNEKPIAGKIVLTLIDAGTLTVNDFNQLTASTVQLVLPNGKTIIGNSMFVTGARTVNASEGTFEVEFSGADVFEQVAA